MTAHEDFEKPTDAAVSRRLARLSSLPVDTTNLERRLRAQLPPASDIKRKKARWWISIGAAAASLVLVATIVLFMLQGREAQASYAQMAQMHQDIVSGKIPTLHANSIDEANAAIAAMAGSFPKLPEPPEAHAMACCMRNIGNKKVACVLLDNDGTPVTMAVASAADIESPKSSAVMMNGFEYHVETVGSLHMVMTERDGRWICLVSALPAERLMDVAGRVRF